VGGVRSVRPVFGDLEESLLIASFPVGKQTLLNMVDDIAAIGVDFVGAEM
jgi:hypothetical protein